MGIGDECSRRGCHNMATRKRSLTTFYCDFHYRMSEMSQTSKARKGDGLTLKAVESLYETIGRPTVCLRCSQAFTWHSTKNGMASLITLQHNNDGTLCFLCHSCNSGHGNTELGDGWLKVNPATEKYCPTCKRVQSLGFFYRTKGNRRDGRYGWCKECSRSYNLARSRGRR